jgi:hypothetical protein
VTTARHIPDDVLPALREAGESEEQVLKRDLRTGTGWGAPLR